MNFEQAETLLHKVNQDIHLKNEDAEFIQNVFSALAVSDVKEIEVKAEQFLQDVDLIKTLRANSVDKEEFLHRVTMDTFNSSMLDLIQDQFPEVDSSVEHDIPSWIEANAEIITIGNLHKLEKWICKEPSQKDVIKFHQQVNLDVCESEINGILQKAWSSIQFKINSSLANYSE